MQVYSKHTLDDEMHGVGRLADHGVKVRHSRKERSSGSKALSLAQESSLCFVRRCVDEPYSGIVLFLQLLSTMRVLPGVGSLLRLVNHSVLRLGMMPY